ncbi:protein ALP1-like [Rhododendron vialii]|uniref:protein ALP1-like n=1 Tax=Rhododendron vialii TaxID=182163 RepID=UPI00265EDB49|nr:protein ALP1-like [Rhododendron vialii]
MNGQVGKYYCIENQPKNESLLSSRSQPRNHLLPQFLHLHPIPCRPPPPRHRPSNRYSCDTEASETSPYKDILSPFDEMKVSSLPNLNRETTSFPNFFTFIQDPADHHHHDTALQIDEHSCDTEASETSPYEGILSPFDSFDKVNEIRLFAGTSSVGLIRRGSVQNQHNTSSVGSNQFSGGGGSATSGNVGPNPAQLRWWDQCSHPDFPESEFRRAFKMRKSTFEFICSELDPVINNKDYTMLRLAIPPEIILVRQCVAVCIWWLATGEPLRLVSQKFGLGISTCRELVLEVCGAIRSVLMSKFLNWPDEEKMTKVKREFELISGIPNVGGSIYTTHVPIIEPEVNAPAYFNKRHTERNQKMSITVQGVVDSRGVFTDVCIGWPGSMSDDKILENSVLSQRASRGLLKDVWIVGNSGYPLMDWLLVPCTHKHLSCHQHVFNEKVGKVQKGAKKAFSRLKGRWSCLQKLTEVQLQDLPAVVGAACVLHNICEMRNEAMDPAKTSFHLFDDEIVPEDAVRSVDAMRARDQIAHHLFHNLSVTDRLLRNY